MIHILPYLEHTIRTTKSPQEIHDIMQSVTSPKGEWYSSRPGEFIGTINQYDFKIMRNINYRNSFLPVIRGAIKRGQVVLLRGVRLYRDMGFIFRRRKT